MTDGPTTQPVADLLDGLKKAREQQDADNKAAHEAKMQEWRDKGIAGLINISTLGPALYLKGPDRHGLVSLYAMEDGTVRWKKAGE